MGQEETHKQLESKFQDVHRKIKSTQAYVNAERKRVNDMFAAFQVKFRLMLNDYQETFLKRLSDESEERKDMQSKSEQRLEDLYE